MISVCNFVAPITPNATSDYAASGMSYIEGSSVTVTCNAGYEYVKDMTVQTINCGATGWENTAMLKCIQCKTIILSHL